MTDKEIEIAKPAIIKKCNKKAKRDTYKILYNEFKGQNPNE